MKETKTESIIPVSELVLEGVYFTDKDELVQVKKIDQKKKEINLFNISQQYNLYSVKFERHNLTKRIR
jgi:hypothetical protein